jgi:hypothetical protein
MGCWLPLQLCLPVEDGRMQCHRPHTLWACGVANAAMHGAPGNMVLFPLSFVQKPGRDQLLCLLDSARGVAFSASVVSSVYFAAAAVEDCS